MTPPQDDDITNSVTASEGGMATDIFILNWSKTIKKLSFSHRSWLLFWMIHKPKQFTLLNPLWTDSQRRKQQQQKTTKTTITTTKTKQDGYLCTTPTRWKDDRQNDDALRWLTVYCGHCLNSCREQSYKTVSSNTTVDNNPTRTTRISTRVHHCLPRPTVSSVWCGLLTDWFIWLDVHRNHWQLNRAGGRGGGVPMS